MIYLLLCTFSRPSKGLESNLLPFARLAKRKGLLSLGSALEYPKKKKGITMRTTHK